MKESEKTIDYNKNEDNTKTISTGDSVLVKTNVQKHKNKKHFNLLDALIILIILACVFVVVMAYLPGGLFSLTSAKDANITYTIEITGVRPELVAGIHVGDKVTEQGSGVFLGQISSELEVLPERIIRYDAALGEVVADDHPDNITVLLTISSTAESDVSKGYTVGSRRIAIGREYLISLPNFEGTGRCISITDNSG